MRRYALRDDQWNRIKDILPGREGHVGVSAKDNRLFVEAVLYRYRAGIPWRDLPERFGDPIKIHTSINSSARPISASNGADLWRCLKAQGFRGSVRVVTEWATRRRRAEMPDARSLQRVPSARTIARLMTNGRDTLSKSETVTIAAIEQGSSSKLERSSPLSIR